MAKTSKSCWTGMEKKHAEKHSKIFGVKTTRVPLSGINSGHNAGDIIIPYDPTKLGAVKYDMLIECKLRQNFMHHTLFENAVEDAQTNKKMKVDPKNVILITRLKSSRGGDLISIHEDLYYYLMSLPGALDWFHKKD